MSRVLLQNIRSGRRESIRLLSRSTAPPVPTILYSQLAHRQSLPFITNTRAISSIGRRQLELLRSPPFVSSRVGPARPTNKSKSFHLAQVSSLHTTSTKQATKKQQQKQEKNHHKTSLLFISAALILAAGASLYAKTAFSNPADANLDQLHHPVSDLEHPFHTMQIPPGRPETLTPDQEQKLKQLWQASLTVFGVGTTGTETSTPADSAAETTPDPSVKEKKKSRLGSLFGGSSSKKEDKNADSSGPDKYNQTEAFKKATQTLTPEELRTAFWDMVQHDNPDGLLLRFLRARKWDVEKALVMMVSTMHWRLKEQNVEAIIASGEGGAKEKGDENFLSQIRMGKSYLHGTDKEGRPICFVRVRLHFKGEQSEESIERYTVYIMETARLMLKHPVDTAAVVFDMTGSGSKNFDTTPVMYLIKCFEAHYPESLGICLVHNAPFTFPLIWKFIQPFLDPVVAAKIHFTNSVDDLAKFIDRSKIPKDMGGDEDWAYSYVEPVPGENKKMKDTEALAKLRTQRREQVERYEELTREWIKSKLRTAEGEDEEVVKIKKERNKVEKELERGYWEIDEYVRARTIYDRKGVINPGGRIVFYPDAVSTLTKGVDKLAVGSGSGDHTEVD
ncbi:hypothetical protein BJ508DRAFT_369064 [Ascobolus immersus RN42]|uniref:CRAL-TRIO domain-containing protein n=1 Tax=Ascobolus immersus RN42 TaxID=1160509 RepID=A0A3N4IS76_ASCIM|nr:hypothetical protein BJ508DRAFT_369064 [Ascobolus immersus RN42]